MGDAALRIVAVDGPEDTAEAARTARLACLQLLQQLLDASDWQSVADHADRTYLAVGRLAALARAAANH
jgi:hypothetical protein